MATPDFTLIPRSQLTSIVTPATKRFAIVFDGQTVEHGNTGSRDLSGQLQNVTAPAAGQLVVIRDGNTITVKTSVTPSAAGQVTIATLPASFRPTTTLYAGGRGGDIGLATGGTLYAFPEAAGATVRATLTFVTEAVWPGALPGVPLGDPVVI